MCVYVCVCVCECVYVCMIEKGQESGGLGPSWAVGQRKNRV